MSLSLYVHIPYCIQRCRYCDFTTFEQSTIMPPENYLKLLLTELRSRHHTVPSKTLRTVYFGGGTPSLVPADHIVSFLSELANLGFFLDQSTEVTIEINPATVSRESLQKYIEAGVNRFSVGAQTFNDSLLKVCGREHNAQQTLETLRMLEKNELNYSFDLLFALPQDLNMLEKDLKILEGFKPKHVSAYCLTVPSGHPMSSGRAPEEEQLEMFTVIEQQLKTHGLLKYEISNFAKMGYESAHNLSYWKNRDYWGLGLSAHSYFTKPNFGVRFWNPKDFKSYEKQILIEAHSQPYEKLPELQVERLKPHESLTDFCHMHLRLREGLHEAPLHSWFSSSQLSDLWKRLDSLVETDMLQKTENGWTLSPRGETLSNRVFSELTFSSEEVH